MDKIDIKNLSKDELRKALAALGEEPYRAGQIFRWLYRARVKSFDEMTDLAVTLREKLKNNFHLTRLTVADLKRSVVDGTVKYLFKLEDANTVESVFIPEDKRATLCLSSQVGCKFGCSFCASAPFGFVRDLKSSEILDEAISIMAHERAVPVTNIVFMGIGEPLDNYDNVMKAVRILNDADAFKIGARRITLSTCGIIPGIRRLSDEKLQVELSVSLHSADDAVRSKILPINKKYPLKDLMASCREYTKKTKRVITFEYVLIKDMNASSTDAGQLARLLKGGSYKVNIISCNQIRAGGFTPPPEKEAKDFMAALKKRGINVTRRKSKGEDIDAGCGQLRIARMSA